MQGALSNVLRGAGGALVLVMYDELKVSEALFPLPVPNLTFIVVTWALFCTLNSCAASCSIVIAFAVNQPDSSS